MMQRFYLPFSGCHECTLGSSYTRDIGATKERFLAVLVLAFAASSVPEDASLLRICLYIGALLCSLAYISRTWRVTNVNEQEELWCTVQRQMLLFGAVALGSVWCRARPSERILQLGVTSIFWNGSGAPTSLMNAMQTAQTLVFCVLHISNQEHSQNSNAIHALFLLSAGLIGIILPLATSALAVLVQHVHSEHADGQQGPQLPVADVGHSVKPVRASPSPRSSSLAASQGVLAYAACAIAAPNGQHGQDADGLPHATGGACRHGVLTSATASQTDDELLLWLLAGDSHAPSTAFDDLKDDARLSASGMLSPNQSMCAGDGSTVNRPIGARTAGVSKYDSFTSVWSRAAVPTYLSRPMGPDGDDILPGPAQSHAMQNGILERGGQDLKGQQPQTATSDHQHHWSAAPLSRQSFGSMLPRRESGRAQTSDGTCAVSSGAGPSAKLDAITETSAALDATASSYGADIGSTSAADGRVGLFQRHLPRRCHTVSQLPSPEEALLLELKPHSSEFDVTAVLDGTDSQAVLSSSHGLPLISSHCHLPRAIRQQGPNAAKALASPPLAQPGGSAPEQDVSVPHEGLEVAEVDLMTTLEPVPKQFPVSDELTCASVVSRHSSTRSIASALTAADLSLTHVNGESPSAEGRRDSLDSLMPAEASGAEATYSHRCSGVQRSRSAGESGFRLLPHQEHRRTALMQVWNLMLGDSDARLLPWHEGTADAHANGRQHAVTSQQHKRMRYMVSADGVAGSSDPSAEGLTNVVVGEALSSQVEQSAGHLLRTPPAMRSVVLPDERTGRLCKSLSQRSLQRAASTPFRRLIRARSRFAILKEEDRAVDGMDRLPPGVSLGAAALENVLEEQEDELAGDGGLTSVVLASQADSSSGSSGSSSSGGAPIAQLTAREAAPLVLPYGIDSEPTLPDGPWNIAPTGLQEYGSLDRLRRAAGRSGSEMSFSTLSKPLSRHSYASGERAALERSSSSNLGGVRLRTDWSGITLAAGDSNPDVPSGPSQASARRTTSVDGAKSYVCSRARPSSSGSGRCQSNGLQIGPSLASTPGALVDGGAGDSSDSDQELLAVLDLEANADIDRTCTGGLRRLRSLATGVGRVSSFRFAAPVVPGVPAPGLAPPYSSASPFAPSGTLPEGPQTMLFGGDLACIKGDGTPTAAYTASDGLIWQPSERVKQPDGRSGVDDIPVTRVAAPVVPEPYPSEPRSRSSLEMSRPPEAGSSVPPDTGTSPAPLSARNLQHHTRHYAAASPATVAVLQLPSPSPSQSGPIDPLWQGELGSGRASDVGASAPSASAEASRQGGLGPSDSGSMVSQGTPRILPPALHGNGTIGACVASAGGIASVARGLQGQNSISTTMGTRSVHSSSVQSEVVLPLIDDPTAQLMVAMRSTSATNQSFVQQQTRGFIMRMDSGCGPHGRGGAGIAMSRSGVAPGASSIRRLSKLGNSMVMDGPELGIEETVMANRRAQDDRGALLDEISIEKVLGFGSMGMVYHGRLYDTKVVIKLIEHGTGVLGKEKERGRLARIEASVSRLLLHPNVVLTYDACTGNLPPGRLAKLGRGGAAGLGTASRGGRQRCMTVMVQEFCELGTLRDAINRKKHGLGARSPDALPLIFRVALDISNGMKHLASLRIIHTDLKAENVLLQKADTCADRPHGFLAKVADFGLAMVLAPGEDEICQGIHGTVSHMPPEAMKDTVFSLATDVFSFGVVLWELYTGESPYRGMAPHEVVEAVCTRSFRPAWPEDSPDELVVLAQDCWHSDPYQRPSFAEVVERLRLLLEPSRRPPERSGSVVSGLSEESDELEAALRQQRRVAAASVPGRSIAASVGGRALSDTGSELGTAAARAPFSPAALLTTGSVTGAEAANVPQDAPRDPLGLLLWALCQYPAAPPQVVKGPTGESEQWVLKVDYLVSQSREREAALRAADLALVMNISREGSAIVPRWPSAGLV